VKKTTGERLERLLSRFVFGGSDVGEEPGAEGVRRTGLDSADSVRNVAGDGENKTQPRPPRPGKCKKYTRDEVAKAMPDIVRKFVEEAKAGSVAHTRLLTLLSGIDKEPIAPPKPRRRKGMVALLIERLEQDHPELK